MGMPAELAKSLAMLSALRGAQSLFPREDTLEDCAETVYVAPLALLKMLSRARGGLPFEVMGILLGKLVDNYSILVTDVMDMPQVASTVAVDAMDSAFQMEMKEMLEEVGRTEEFVGWYHSHPGYGCYLGAVDRETQTGFQGIQPRAIAIVVDPVQSVRGRVVLETFRVVDAKASNSLFSLLAAARKPRHVTSARGLADLKGPDYRKMLSRGLDRLFYKLHTVVELRGVPVPLLLSIAGALRDDADPQPNILAAPAPTDAAALIRRLTQLSSSLAVHVAKRPDNDARRELRHQLLATTRGLMDSTLLGGLRSALLRSALNLSPTPTSVTSTSAL